MKLNGVNITTCGLLKKYFNLESVWENIENGVFLEFEKNIADGGFIKDEILRTLEMYYSQTEDTAEIPGFDEGKWDIDVLDNAMDTLDRVNEIYIKEGKKVKISKFRSLNEKSIKELIYGTEILWNFRSALVFYLFLLIEMQIRSGDIVTGDFDEIKKRLTALNSQTFQEIDECGSLLKARGKGIYYLKNGRIYDDTGKLRSPVNECIACYTYTSDLGLLAITDKGALSACVDDMVRMDLEERLNTSGESGQKLKMISAYNKKYAVITQSGKVVSNLNIPSDWADIRWVWVGLNSVAAIRGKMRTVLESGSDKRLTDMSGVREVYTKTEYHLGNALCRYVVLKDDGTLLDDSKNAERNVTAVYLYGKGYIYAKAGNIYQREFAAESAVLCGTCSKGTVTELCMSSGNIYYRCVDDKGYCEKEYMVLH